ncbi:BcPKS16, polyketide synthase [Melanomma pulvis-pyrius CBS 109.77]|uniref:BcPKS16, polyketide synthase n=1 Tax=Melanomma pulvis-pyrius CBS 109.77 TaxID=1314802 RepID=A0A6A6X733_9PLEO|nr:BcPKS16, polyketide synthase [Melanomma pulvis-pyrius CBS 109.77]
MPQVSAAFFNPQSRAPTPDYLSNLYVFLCHHPHGRVLLQHVADLHSTWPVWASAREDVRTLPNAEHYVSLLVDWAKGGPSTPVSEARTGVIALPLLLILQLGQYFRYLEHHSLSHADFIDQTRQAGGIQGCCGGEPPALSIACAENEAHVVENAAVLLRILLGFGAYIEALDDWTSSEPTVLAVRLKHEAQREELLYKFPRVYVSAITEPRSISFVGSATSIASLYEYARSEGLPADKMDVTGKAHNPENSYLVPEFLDILKRNPSLFQLPQNSRLQVTVRSNRTGEQLSDDFVIEDMVTMILAACCDWHEVVSQVANDMEASGRTSHHTVLFGMNDSVPQSPFNMRRLKVSKFKAHTLISDAQIPTQVEPILSEPFEIPETSIAVVGVACRLPGADNLKEIWDLISNGGDKHQELPKDRIDPSKSFRISQDSSLEKRRFFGNFVNDVRRFDHTFFGVNAKEAAALDPQQRMLLELSYEALESSGYLATHSRDLEDAVGCFIGNSMNEYLENATSHGPSAYTATGTIRAIMCGRLSHYYGWSGPSEVIDTACSSSLVAVHRACRAIQSGECHMAIAGGASAITHLNSFLDLGKAGFLSPTGQCKPFDASADGYCRAEGAGLVVLKKLSAAISAGDQILGVIPSIATNQGGTSTSLTVPSLTALKSLHRKVLDDAGIKASDVSYIEAHAPGTQAGDPIEMESIRAVFASTSRSVPLSIGSIKGNIGHCESAAGIAGLLKVLAMLRYGGVPPQANHCQLNPKIPDITKDKMEITRSLRNWDVSRRAALVNSYGAGGSNCALLCCEMPRIRTNNTQPSMRSQPTAYPIILSAASSSSLTATARSLAEFLSSNSSKVTISDVAFTLSQRRKRQKYCFTTSATSIPDLVHALKSIRNPSFEYRSRSKAIVLAFSGQYDDKIALPLDIYESYPRFRAHIDSCDEELIKLGFKSIKSAIFQTEPIPSALLLQSSIFAVQFACAQCWIEAGLQPDAIIGHSLGEIVGMAVAGVLSMRDALSLVAFRAHLIDTEWENEKGQMLAIHSDVGEVARMLHRLETMQKGTKVEIACYNAPTSVVVAGTSVAIRLMTQILSDDADFAGIKHQRLSTSHAFHSSLVDPILPKLEQISRNLTWNHPIIPFETCSRQGLPSMQDWSASAHARDPVYFNDAVKRIEQRLGSCIWVEAGLDTPIISMARRACSNQGVHALLEINTRRVENPLDCIGNAISLCWQHGISLSHWAFLSARESPCRQIWLPPYQFDSHQHWIKHVDRAMEAHQLLTAHSQQSATVPAIAPPRLVVRKCNRDPRSSSSSGNGEYSINTVCERYQKVVRGHAVLGNPLCPAPLYMECASMALYDMLGHFDVDCLTFQDLQFHAPLGSDLARTVDLYLEEAPPEPATWKFAVRSTSPKSTTGPVLHCMGTAYIGANTSLSTYGRLAQGLIDNIQASPTTERLMPWRAYSLFSKVMLYAPFFKGITSLTLARTEALATVKLPTNQPARHESRVWHRCDAVLIDAFISVVGLLLNSSDVIMEDEIAIATAMGSVVLTQECQAESKSDWLVYAKFVSEDAAQPMGDVYVFNSGQELVAMMTGVRFAVVNASKMTKTLAAANSPLSLTPQPDMKVIHPRQMPSTDTNVSETAEPAVVSTPPEASPDVGLREMISNYTGIPAEEVSSNIPFVDLGLDSLSSIDFVAELEAQFAIVVRSEELSELTLDDIIQKLDKSDLGEVQSRLAKTLSSENAPHPPASPPSQLKPHHHTIKESIPTRLYIPIEPTALTQAPNAPYNPFIALLETDSKFEEAAHRRGYVAYHANIAPLQDDLTLAYILEAFKALGCNIRSLSSGSIVTPIQHVPKHEKLAARLWDVLQQRSLIVKQGSIKIRSREKLQLRTSHEIYDDMTSRFPKYLPEARLMKLAGENLARCLRGEQDGLSLLFGSASSNNVMEDYYASSPMVSTLTDQLVTFVTILLRNALYGKGPIHVLEVGAGTGATTSRLAETINATGIRCEYVFTDISSRMVTKAKQKLREYPWITYELFDLEKEVPTSFRNRFDIVIGTNCVHATTSRVATCRRIFETLKADGVIVLSEGTRPMHWFDICFGLLDGWWVAENGTQYPLQPATKWMDAFKQSGFLSSSFSRGPTQEANTQQLLVGCKKMWPVPIELTPTPIDGQDDTYRLETMTYKEVNGVKIFADVYIPRTVKTSSIPIALMIHGGGYMTLSRKAIRREQTRYLLSHGFLPVSLDYRLCPEVDIISGPIADVQDGYIWARTQLPLSLLKYGISLDNERVVLVGWSTGGHLALSVGWTAKEAGIPPPTAILSFYAPLDFESGELDNHAQKLTPLSKSHRNIKFGKLSGEVLTNYMIEGGSEDSSFFGLQPGDPRSDLILSMCRDGTGLALLLHEEFPSKDQIAAISPLAQLRKGCFDTPTFIIHSRKDEVTPFNAAENFMEEMRLRGGDCTLLALDSASHLHDLRLERNDRAWKDSVEPGYKFLIEAASRNAV